MSICGISLRWGFFVFELIAFDCPPDSRIESFDSCTLYITKNSDAKASEFFVVNDGTEFSMLTSPLYS